jgi:perosamine synthetase
MANFLTERGTLLLLTCDSMIPIYTPYLTKNTIKYATEAIESGWISSHGKYKRMAEDLLCEQFDAAHALLVSNGTCATHLLAKSLKFRHPNINRIIAPNNCYVAAWNSFLFDGYDWKIELIDSNLKTWNADYANIEADKNTAFLIVPNLGNMIDVSKLKELYPKSIFVEDNCEGFFGLYNNKRAGSESECISLSFFGNKDLTSGEGGAVLTSNLDIYEYIKKIHSQGQSTERYIHDELGYNYRMTNIQAAILYGQLQDAEEIRDKKSHIFEVYRKELKNEQSISFQEADNSVHSNWMFGIRIHNNKGYKHAESFFKENKIETRPMFYPASTHKYLKNYKQVSFGSETNSLILNKQCLLLPSYPSLADQDLNHIISSVKKYAIYDK